MRIVIDMQGAQTESRFRGIGRYTLAFAKAVVRNRGEHEVILALSGLFPDTIDTIRAAFDGLLPPENICVWSAPGPVKAEHPDNNTRRKTAELVREAFLASLQPDLIHITSLFEGYLDDAVTSIGRFDTQTPVSVSLYDLIPLLNPAQYLTPNPRYAAYYEDKIASLREAQWLLAISAYSRQEGIQTLNASAEHIVNVGTAIGAEFQPLTIAPAASTALLSRLGITRPFVLYTGGADERKNLPRLIEAWSALPAPLRHNHQLLFAGRMSEFNILEFRRIARQHGLQPDELLFSGYISDEELVQLYNLCKLYVFPSWHEGFGLPALEAMACGAPVIGANTTSLPEVIDLPEALFDPYSATAIRDKIQQALTDGVFRQKLCAHGLQQVKKFTWDKTAKQAMAAWEKNASRHCPPAPWQKSQEHSKFLYENLVKKIAALPNENLKLVNLRQLAACLEKNEQQIFSYLRKNKLPQKITWRIEGPFDSSYSLALVNREIARALAFLGHAVVLHSTEGPGDFNPNADFLLGNPDLAEMHQRADHFSAWDVDITSRNLYPPRVADMHSRLNSLHAYGWEESGFPLEWADNFNMALQGMTVMSSHVQKIMQDHGVAIPIVVSSIGTDHWQKITPDHSLVVQGKKFRFLHVSSCFPRKGADVMLQAYGSAFSASDDVTLIIKTFPNPHNAIHQWLADARNSKPDFPDVKIIEEDFTDGQLKALYEQCHALVAPSRAEGFGLPMAEAMLSGLSVITTGWSGQTDFCTPENSWLIDYDFQRAQSHFGIFSSVWAEPKLDHLAQIMREVYQTPESVRQQKTAIGQQLLAQAFCWRDTASRMVEAARNWSEKTTRPTPRTGWVSSWNTKCGIASYSEHLIRNMPSEVQVLAAHTHAPTAADESNVLRCWTTGDSDFLKDLDQAIISTKINALVIQFNYGFFNFEHLSSFLFRQKSAGLKVVIVLHATNDPAHAPHKKLSFLAPALAQCDRVLVHSVDDLNRLKLLGLTNNVTLFPHGVLDYDSPAKNLQQTPDYFTVTSYGFFLPHKGLLELILAIEILHKKGMKIRLKMVNAEYPAPESRLAIEQAKSTVAKKGLGHIIEFNTEYLPDSMSIKMLSDADLVIFPYQETGESSSAAVRYGIACGRPVAATPLGIFDDVASAVHFLPGTSPQAIADGISTLAQDIASAAPRFLEKNAASERWRNEHKYSKLGSRIHGLITAVGNTVQTDHLPQRRKQLLFDVSQVYQHDDGTGIQRVVRNILAELQRATPTGYDICPVYGTKAENFRYTGKFHPAGSTCAHDGQAVIAGPGDIFLAVDLTAHLFPEAEQHLQALRQAGARVFYVVHDIIPLRHTQYTIPFIQQAFDVWLRALGRCADGLVCVSNAVAQDVAAWLQEHQSAPPLPPIAHFHLGADMERAGPTQSLPPESAAVLQHIRARTSFLLVGTIEPRKGHAQTLAAFELLWAQGVQANLVIVGKSGWNTEDLSQQLRQHPENGQRLFWLEGINDAYLEAVYAASTCLIAASYCEGFGLPLIEAARYRLPILARGIPVFREVAGEHAAYFEGPTPQDLANAIERWLALHASGQHPRPDAMPWQTWAQSAQQLLQHILPAAAPATAPAPA